MFETKRVCCFAGIVVLALAVLFGCDLLWEPPERIG